MQDKQTRDSANKPEQKGGVGRTSNIKGKPNEQKDGKPDISQVDQQEGEMNNGELGGNYKEEEDRLNG